MNKTKIITLISCAFLLVLPSFAQKNKQQIVNYTKIVGKDPIVGTDIKGEEFVFPGKIYELFYDTITYYFTVQTKDIKKNDNQEKTKGSVFQWDIKNRKVLWSKKMNYGMNQLLQFGNVMIFNEYNDCYGIDQTTGENLWQLNNYIAFVEPKKNTGITYEYSIVHGDYTNTLMGFDLSKRKLLWTRSIYREFHKNGFFYINDSTLFVVAAGLHSINVNSGEGWDYRTITGVAPTTSPDIGSYVAGAVAGALLGVLTGVIVVPIYYQSMNPQILDLSSNALFDDNFIYFSSKDQIAKIEKESGEMIWKNSFIKMEDNCIAKSLLFMDNSYVYMINKGYTLRNDKIIKYGIAFVAAYEKETGKQRYLQLAQNKKDIIFDSKLIDDNIFLLKKNKIAICEKNTGIQIIEKQFHEWQFEELSFFEESNVFVPNQYGNYVLLQPSCSTHVNVYDVQKNILSVDHNLNATNFFQSSEVFYHYLTFKDYLLIGNDIKTFIINKEGKKIAELEVSKDAFIMDGVLYDKRFKSVVAIDLKELLP